MRCQGDKEAAATENELGGLNSVQSGLLAQALMCGGCHREQHACRSLVWSWRLNAARATAAEAEFAVAAPELRVTMRLRRCGGSAFSSTAAFTWGTQHSFHR